MIRIGVLLWVAGQPIGAQSYLVRHYCVADGLPSSQIRDITQDALGQMWFATRSGVAVYDGTRWVTYNVADGLRWADVFALRWDSQGALWSVGSLPPFKISSFQDGGWRAFESSPQVARSARISAFAVLGNASPGWLVIGTGDQGLRLRRLGGSSEWFALTERDGLPSDEVTAFGIGGEGSTRGLLVATAAGLVELRDERLDGTLRDVVPQALLPVTGLAREGGEQGDRWWVLGRDWIGQLENRRLRVLAEPGSFPAAPATQPMVAVSDRHGGLYFGRRGGLFHFHPEEGVERLDRSNGLLDSGTTALFVDREGNLWVAGPGGLSKLVSRWFGRYNRSHGLFDDEVTAVLERRDGTLVLGHRGGLSFLDDAGVRSRELRPADRRQDRRPQRVRDLAEDRQGNLWAALDNYGLARLDPSAEVTWFGGVTTPLGGASPSEAVSSVRLDGQGHLWVGTTEGLYRRRAAGFDKVFFERVTFGPPRIHVRRLFEGPQGAVLVASDAGLYRYSEAAGWRHWTCADLGCSSVFAVLPAPDGDLWVGTSVGLYHLADDRLVKVPEPAVDRPVYFLVRDLTGRVWFGIDNGVLRWDGQRLEHFTVRDGLAGREANRAAGLVDSRGRVWIGTERGVTRYLETPHEPARAAPIVVLKHLDAAGRKLPLAAPQKLEYDPYNMIFHFRVVSLVDEDRIELSSWLEGIEERWQEPRNLTVPEIRYTNLPPGRYRLHLRARSPGGAWSVPVTSAEITVARPFWNQPWFFLALVVGLGGTLYAAQRHVVQRRYSQRLETEVAERVAQLRSEVEDRRRAEAELRVAKDAAESADRAKSEFLANMSHEIRTPLNAVIGLAQLLMHERLEGRAREYAATIFKSGDSLLHLVNEILDFSKLDSRVQEIEHLSFDLGRCVEAALDIVAPRAAARDLELIYSIDKSCPLALVGDSGRLEQVLVNLLDNAIKFTSAGEVSLHLAAAAESGVAARTEPASELASEVASGRAGSAGGGPAPRQEVRFEVRDTGIGIDPEQLPMLFEPFTQVDASSTRKYSGTGLGLAISKQLVELMGGSIQATSEPGKGSCFTFTIMAPASPERSRVYPRGHRPQLAGKKLLIVDDNPACRQALERLVRDWGLRPTPADAEDALARIRSGERFDAAIIDLKMPGLGGRALARTWLEEAKRPPIVLMSYVADRGERSVPVEEEDAGDTFFLSKPVKPPDLHDVLIRLFAPGRRRPRPQSPAEARPDDPAAARPLHLLLAEDNRVNQIVMADMLTAMGHQVEVVGTGEEALRALETSSYDAVLLDIRMPKMDGLEASRRICRRWPPGERPRLIALTAHASKQDRDRCLAAGMDDFITKPIRLESLQEALARAEGPRTAK